MHYTSIKNEICDNTLPILAIKPVIEVINVDEKRSVGEEPEQEGGQERLGQVVKIVTRKEDHKSLKVIIFLWTTNSFYREEKNVKLLLHF